MLAINYQPRVTKKATSQDRCCPRRASVLTRGPLHLAGHDGLPQGMGAKAGRQNILLTGGKTCDFADWCCSWYRLQQLTEQNVIPCRKRNPWVRQVRWLLPEISWMMASHSLSSTGANGRPCSVSFSPSAIFQLESGIASAMSVTCYTEASASHMPGLQVWLQALHGYESVCAVLSFRN